MSSLWRASRAVLAKLRLRACACSHSPPARPSVPPSPGRGRPKVWYLLWQARQLAAALRHCLVSSTCLSMPSKSTSPSWQEYSASFQNERIYIRSCRPAHRVHESGLSVLNPTTELGVKKPSTQHRVSDRPQHFPPARSPAGNGPKRPPASPEPELLPGHQAASGKTGLQSTANRLATRPRTCHRAESCDQGRHKQQTCASK